MLWTMALTYPLMTAVQLVSAQIGRVTGCGLAKNIGTILPKPVVLLLVGILFFANTINIGANLAAMGAATRLVIGGSSHICTVGIAILSLVLQLFVSYERYASYLKKALVQPSFPLSGDSATMVVAILGTTISPYLLFCRAAKRLKRSSRRTRQSLWRKRHNRRHQNWGGYASIHLWEWQYRISLLLPS